MWFAFRFKNARDTSWTEIGTQQDILLSNITPGKYDLQFRLRAFDNKWPEQMREIKMTILPPFWRTPWFIACIAMIFSTCLYGAYLLRIRYIRRRTSIDKHLAELEMKALHAQMNPHFIFNALNCIQDMVLDDDKKNASRYLSRFAQLIRLNLEHSKRTFITLRENIEYLQYYLTMEQMRFEDLQFTIITDPSIDTNEACLPPMLIQPLVENAIWHGLLLKEGEKKLQIRFSQKSDVLICEIEDNGVGLRSAMNQQNPHEHHSVGIRNINQRIEVLNQKYKIHYQLNINDKEDMPQSKDSGTIAVLQLPLHEMFS
jgi:LytS/YehU family sensor histidine kinase